MLLEHIHKKFDINRTKIKDGCQSGRKVVTHISKSDLPLVEEEEVQHCRCVEREKKEIESAEKQGSEKGKDEVHSRNKGDKRKYDINVGAETFTKLPPELVQQANSYYGKSKHLELRLLLILQVE